MHTTILPVRFQSALKVNFIVTSTIWVLSFSPTIKSNLDIYLGFDPNWDVSEVEIFAATKYEKKLKN